MIDIIKRYLFQQKAFTYNNVKMLNRAVLVVFFVVVYGDINKAVETVTIEQTHGYKDTWTNMSLTCSLLGAERPGSVRTNRLNFDTHTITGTGWISAHVEHNGTLQFLGCFTGYIPAGNSGLEASQNMIPECIYFCKSDDFYLYRNVCYCNIRFHAYKQTCLASQCSFKKLLFCGESNIQSGKCVCHYRSISKNIKNVVMAGSCTKDDLTNCKLYKRHNHRLRVTCQKTHGKCSFSWNGFLMKEVFYWGTSSSVISNHQHDCIAFSRVNTNKILTLVTLPCSSKQTGICIKGTRISTTQQATSSTTVILPTTLGHEISSSDLTSHKLPQHTRSTYGFHRSTIDIRHDTLFASTTTLSRINSTAIKDRFTSVIPLQSSSEHIRDQTTHNQWSVVDEMTTSELTSDIKNRNQTTNILEPVLCGVGIFVVLVIVGVVVMFVCFGKRRRKSNKRSHPPCELNNFPSRNQKQNQYINCVTKHREGQKQILNVDTGDYDSLRMTDPQNAVYDLYDHTSEGGDNLYGPLNHNCKETVSLENADIYDHSRTVGQINGDTYDTFQAGVCRDDCSADYYDHTHVGGEDNGYLEKGSNRNEKVDGIYDHTRGHGQSNGGTYDTFQTGRGREEASEDCYDHTGASAGYGYLQKGSTVTVPSNNDYDTINMMKG